MCSLIHGYKTNVDLIEAGSRTVVTEAGKSGERMGWVKVGQ
jgi:hypothetical protein